MPLSLRNETEYPPGGAVIKTKSQSLFPDFSNSKPPPSTSLEYAFINSDITSNAHNPLFSTSFFSPSPATRNDSFSSRLGA